MIILIQLCEKHLLRFLKLLLTALYYLISGLRSDEPEGMENGNKNGKGINATENLLLETREDNIFKIPSYKAQSIYRDKWAVTIKHNYFVKYRCFSRYKDWLVWSH